MAIRIDHVLAVAVSTGKVGFVFLVDGVPYDWGLSLVATASERTAYKHATDWIEYYQPELVVTERINASSRKKAVSRALTNAILKAAQDHDVFIATTDRVCEYANKHKEATMLAKRFPELEDRLPEKRQQWESEPRPMIIFEALSLALRVIEPHQDMN